MAGGGRVVQLAGTSGQLGREHHADADGFAVAHPVALAPLDGVPERVAVVEQLPADPDRPLTSPPADPPTRHRP